MKLEFDHSKSEAENIKTFFFKPEKHFDFTAGQYLEIHLKHKDPDSRGSKRWFTISSSPENELVSITIKIAESKGSSFKKALLKLKQGDIVDAIGPMGDFVLPKIIQTPLVFVAGGIGITPFHSILSWLIETKEERPVKLIYAVKNEDEIIFQDTFDKAKQHATIVIEKPSESWGGERGHITAEMILGISEPSDDSLIYVSGPESMVETLEADLKKSGVNKHQLVLDFFPNYQSY